MLNAIHSHNTNPSTPVERKVPIPEPIVLCEDISVIGTPFYIMEFLEGRIFTDSRMPEIPLETRREWSVVQHGIDYIEVYISLLSSWLGAVRALAMLSHLSPAALGLSSFASSTAYFPRQIKSLSRISIAQSQAVDVDTGKPTGPIPRFNEMIEWYKQHLPDENKTGVRIVHGDYKLDNLVFHPTENRVIGILDWELCTLGSPVRL